MVSTFLDTIKFPGLLRYAPRLVDPANPKTSEVKVTTPEGNDYSADSPELVGEVTEKTKRNLAVVRIGRGAYHSMPVSLLSTASIGVIEGKVGKAVDTRRFRENVIVETNTNVPYEEDTWIGKIITFGDRPDSAKIVAVKLDERCATVNLDPETGEQNPEILKAIVREHVNTLGIYCGIVYEGKIRKGDPVYLTALQ